MTLYLDVDGILSDLTGSTCRALGVDPATVQWRGRYDVAEVLGVRQGRIDALWRTPGFWLGLPVYDGAVEFVDKLAAMADLTLITRAVGEMCAAEKYAWVHAAITPPWNLIIEVPDSPPRCDLAEPGAVLIDDSDLNRADWNAAGGHALRFDTPWNSGYPCYKGHGESYAKVIKAVEAMCKITDTEDKP